LFWHRANGSNTTVATIHLDAAGQVYAAGYTNSSNFTTTGGAFQAATAACSTVCG